MARVVGLASSGGSSAWQRSRAYAHRGANWHPTGGLTRSGGRPGIVASRECAGSSSLGMLCISASVYGIRMLANSVFVGAFSTSRPPYITAISSVCPATTPRSWVTRITDMLRSWRCSAMRSRICDCTVTSRAVVGSSANSSVGPQARAMAIITRWRMPPDSSCGYWSRRRAASGMRTSRSSRSAVSRALLGHLRGALATARRSGRRSSSAGSARSSGPGRSSPSPGPRRGASADVDRPISSCPSNLHRALADRGSCRRAVPSPNETAPSCRSPTRRRRPSVPPRSSEKLTPSTARTTPRGVRKWVMQVGDLEQRAALGAVGGLDLPLGHQIVASRMSKRRASQSPIMLNDSTVINSIRHGNTVAHQPWSMSS